ncbi:MAG: peptidoglycan-associated lipoprotein Pal [Deltaproteobacteria bacterium]|nr:peptidoglycan-associated lipoprotein Pal [Deltaproteobacteria bacterium]
MRRMGIGIVCVLCMLLVGCAAGKKQVKTPSTVAPGETTVQGEAIGVPSVEEKVLTPQEAFAKEAKEVFINIHFDFDKYNIKPDDIPTLNKIVAFMKKYPNTKIKVEGNCDERGTEEYNLALGQRRANAALRYIVARGIASSRIETVSYGESKPVDPRHCEEAWAKNRNDHFVVISK